MAGGQLVADGAALLAPSMTGSGKTLEFMAAFTGGPGQSIGFGASSVLGSPMAMFVIGSDRQLYARSVNGARTLDTLMGGVDWLGKSLRYQITWNAGNAQYCVNGSLMITHSSMAWGAVTMRPVIIDTAAATARSRSTGSARRRTPRPASTCPRVRRWRHRRVAEAHDDQHRSGRDDVDDHLQDRPDAGSG